MWNVLIPFKACYNWLQNKFTRWSATQQINVQLAHHLLELTNVIKGLNASIGRFQSDNDNMEVLLSAVIFQYGGEIDLKNEFIEIIKNNSYRATVKSREDGNYLLGLTGIVKMKDFWEEKEKTHE